MVKNPPANAGDLRDSASVPAWGRCPGGGHGNPLQYSCLENPMDRGAWGHKEFDPVNFASLVSGTNHLVNLLFLQAYTARENLKATC